MLTRDTFPGCKFAKIYTLVHHRFLFYPNFRIIFVNISLNFVSFSEHKLKSEVMITIYRLRTTD